MNNWRSQNNWIQYLLLFLLGFLTYSLTLKAGFIWDDDTNLLTKDFNSLKTLYKIWFEPTAFYHQYYPLTHTSFWIEHKLWGLNPSGYHLINIFLHILNGMLILNICRLFKIPGAFFIAGIFTVHPVHVESVAWITERKNMLSLLFYLLSIMFFFKFVFKEKKETLIYILSLFFFTLALLSKTAVCTLPFTLLILLWWKGTPLLKTHYIKTIPFFVIAFILGLITLWLEKNQLGSTWDISFYERILIAGRAFWFYPAKLLWPADIVFIYPKWSISLNDWTQYIYPIGAVLLIAYLTFFSSRQIKGPLSSVLIYLISLLPAIGLIDHFMMRYSFVADHLNYLPSISLIVLFSSLGIQLLGRISKKYAAIIGAAILATFAVNSFALTKSYLSEEHLYKDIIKKNDKASLAHNNLGKIYAERDEFDQAHHHFNKALEYDPSFYEAHINKGWTFTKQNQPNEAIRHLAEALRQFPNNGRMAFELGRAYEAAGRLSEAEHIYRQLIEAYPNESLFKNKLDQLKRF